MDRIESKMVLWIALAALLAVGCGDDDDNDADGDAGADGDSDSDTDTDADSDSDSDTDTGTGNDWSCAGNEWDEVWTYGEAYAPGPYGFKGSMCWNPDTMQGNWTTLGDTIPDVCLPNQDDVEVCLHDFYQSTEFDLLIVDFTAMWCPPCNAMADDEHDFLQAITDAGYRPLMISIVEEPYQQGGAPTAADAATWKSTKSIPEDVLYDASHSWLADVMQDKWPGDSLGEQRGYPTWFVVHTSNMLIWDSVSGWDTSVISWVANDMLPYLKNQPGATEELTMDGGVDGGN